ncbi:MAG TPA: histidine--tRNA ligase, partial [Desulfobulbaceae bacterium]|nr:histidine--tRNA ligase [Desulfobulbaceae bacterium]
GMERLVLLMEQQENATPPKPMTDLFVAALGKKAAEHASILIHAIRKLGLTAAMDYSGRSLKAQMKQAGRLNSRFTLIIGENELACNEGVLRDMNTQEQTKFSLSSSMDEQAQHITALLSA